MKLTIKISKKALETLQEQCRHKNTISNVGWYCDGFRWEKVTCTACGKTN